MTLIAFAFGVHMVMAIGGADMPVVISMLNSRGVLPGTDPPDTVTS
jgi:NAD/NADP transhydrogenase beta subunit